MQTYSLSSLSPKRNKPSVTLAPVFETPGGVRAYRAALRAMLKDMAKETQASVVSRYRADQQMRKAFGDADESWFNKLALMAARLTFVADQMVNRTLRLEAKKNTKGFMRSAKRALGIDLSAVVRENDMEAAFNAIMVRNSALIKSLADDTISRVRQSTIEAYMNGDSVSKLQSRLKHEFGVMDSRAKLIARDQLAKANADFNRLRHEQAGITEYVWSTSRDERVRERHRRLDGTRYKYGESTGAEGGLPPGKPINCRCVARAVVEF